MKNYLISIFSITLIVTLINLILPKGKLTKYVKSTCSFILAFTIVFPLVNFNNLDINSCFNDENIEINLQEDYISYVFEEKKRNDYQIINQILSNYGINNAEIKIEYNVVNLSDFTPKKIKINLCKEQENVNISKEQVKIVLGNYFNIESENILLYD